jgi:hypothetical protein
MMFVLIYLRKATLLLPLNNFIYTWRFLDPIAREKMNSVRKTCSVVKWCTFVLPAGIYGFYVAISYYSAKLNYAKLLIIVETLNVPSPFLLT